MSPDHKDLIERLRSYARDYTSTTFHEDLVLDAADAIAALVAERDAAVSDAERYRWLRNARSPFCVSRYDKRPNEHYYGIDLDDAIDAARKNAG